MSEGRGEPGSFDPRTWLGGADPAAAMPKEPAKTPQGSDDLSFDPRAWAGKEAAEPQPDAPPASIKQPPARPRSPIGMAAGVSLAILVAGAVTAYALPSPPQPATASATPTESGASAAAPKGIASRRTLVIAAPDQLPETLAQTGLAPADAKAVTAAALSRMGPAGGEIRLVIDLVDAGGVVRLTRLEATRSDGSGAVLTAAAEGYKGEALQAKLTTVIQSARGEMDATSFYSSAVAAGINDTLISEIAKAFSFDFDFQQEIAPGDVFEAAWEQKMNPAGEPVGPPQLVYAQMTTATKSKALYRFLAPGDTEPGWYDGNGNSTVRALMRTPVDGARISSKFGFRKHPIQGYQKLHRGTDFAAPMGTPMYAAGSGVLEVAGPRGCAGNFVVIRHDNGWQTRYMHLSRFADGMTVGSRITQGQQIGAVGTTGCSTGPHLHYEVWIDGEPVDPLSIDTGTGKQLGGDGLAAFRKERDRIDVSRSQRVE